jgi:hypothetical protein
MRSPTTLRVACCLGLAVALGACHIGIPPLEGTGIPGRYTYIVRYALSGTISAAADVTYVVDTSGTVTTAAAVAPGWAVEVPATYGSDAQFVPSIRIFNTSLATGENALLPISGKDYGTGFAEEILAEQTLAVGAGPLAQDYTLAAPAVPR